MNEKAREVRLGLVLYGGVSLAVYIHGVCRELFELVRGRGGYGPLQRLLDADVVVDIVSGTSAGGVNGIFLARALATNGDFAQCADLWRRDGDILALLNDPRAREFEDGATVPPALLRSETFYQQRLEQALAALSGGKSPDRDFEIDVFVTSTDFHGRTWQEVDGRGSAIDVKEHRTVFHLKHRPAVADPDQPTTKPFRVRKSAFVEHDYADEVVCKALARIGRATSAFPFAFRPVHYRKDGDAADRVLHGALQEMSGLGDEAWLVDGGVLDNKPFSHTTREIAFRAASREVVRKILYVEPDPERFERSRRARAEPGAEDVVLAALLTIPRYESIAADLHTIRDRNEHVRRFRRLADEILAQSAGAAPTTSSDASAFARLGREHPVAQRVYVRARATALRDLLLPHLRKTPEGAAAPALDQWIQQSAEAWIGGGAAADGADELRHYLPIDVQYHLRRHFHAVHRAYAAIYPQSARGARRGAPQREAGAQAVLQFLYRQIEVLQAAEVTLANVVVAATPALVAQLADAATRPSAIADLAARIRAALPDVAPAAVAFDVSRSAAAANEPRAAYAFQQGLQQVYERLRRGAAPPPAPDAPTLPEATSRRTEQWFEQPPAGVPSGVAEVVRGALAEFPRVDLHLFPLQLMSGVIEQDEITVVRVSPFDTKHAAGLGEKLGITGHQRISGDTLFHFGGFFERAWRSNDILWGRLDAAEILVDALVTADLLGDPARLAALRADLAATGLSSRAGAPDPDDPDALLDAVKGELIEVVQRSIVLEEVPQLAYDRALDEQRRRSERAGTTLADQRRVEVRTRLLRAQADGDWDDFDQTVDAVIQGLGQESIGDAALTPVLQAALGAGILIDRRIGKHLEGRDFLGAGFARGIRAFLAMPMRVLYGSLRLHALGNPLRSWMLVALLTTFVVALGLLVAHTVTATTPVFGWSPWLTGGLVALALLAWFARSWRELLGAMYPGVFVFAVAWMIRDGFPGARWAGIAITAALCFLAIEYGRRLARGRRRRSPGAPPPQR